MRPSMQRGGAELVKRSREPEPDPRMFEETGSDSPGTSPAVEGPPLARWTRLGKQEVGMPQPYELFHRNRTTSCESVGQEVVTAQPYELSHVGPTRIEQQAADPSSRGLIRLSLMNYSMGIEQQAVKPTDSRKVHSQIPRASELFHGNRTTALELRGSSDGYTSKSDTAIETDSGQGCTARSKSTRLNSSHRL